METLINNIIIKHPNKSGARTICNCLYCNKLFSELNIRIRYGKGKFCSNKCYLAYRKENKQDIHELNKFAQKKNKYGLDKESYLHLFDIQNNKCAICGKTFNDKIKAFVDHDHITGKVRGLLCTKCNSVLGFANDSIDILNNAIQYLKNNN